MMLTDLADACRKSGLRVVEVDGWRTRGHGGLSSLDSIVCHHTATSRAAAGDYPSLRIVRDGRTGLPGPLSQLGLGRNGTVYVIAAGVAYHAGETFNPHQDNWHALGIEAEHDGVSPWPVEQHAAYARLVVALVTHYGIPVANVQGHKEVAKPLGRKIDPTFSMDDFRRLVAAATRPPRKAGPTAKKITNAIQRAKKDGAPSRFVERLRRVRADLKAWGEK